MMAINFWQIKEVVLTVAAIVFAQNMVVAEPLRTASRQVAVLR
jgi:hypothetical protein